MNTIELTLSNGKQITVVKDKIETIKINPNKNGHSFIGLTSKTTLSVNHTVQEIKEFLSEQ